MTDYNGTGVVTPPPRPHHYAPPKPRITTAEPMLTTLVKASTLLREAGWHGLPPAESLLVPHPGHLMVLVEDDTALARWAAWLGADCPEPGPVPRFQVERPRGVDLFATVGAVV